LSKKIINLDFLAIIATRIWTKLDNASSDFFLYKKNRVDNMLLALVAIKKELNPLSPNKMGQDHRLALFF
jgi:hypothetical protein